MKTRSKIVDLAARRRARDHAVRDLARAKKAFYAVIVASLTKLLEMHRNPEDVSLGVVDAHVLSFAESLCGFSQLCQAVIQSDDVRYVIRTTAILADAVGRS